MELCAYASDGVNGKEMLWEKDMNKTVPYMESLVRLKGEF